MGTGTPVRPGGGVDGLVNPHAAGGDRGRGGGAKPLWAPFVARAMVAALAAVAARKASREEPWFM